MAVYHTSMVKIIHSEILDRYDLTAHDCTVEGGPAVTWYFDGLVKADFTITVLNYDQSRYGEYDNAYFKPHVIIKSLADCSFGSFCFVKDVAGTTLYTFNTNATNTPVYCVLRLDTNRQWELA